MHRSKRLPASTQSTRVNQGPASKKSPGPAQIQQPAAQLKLRYAAQLRQAQRDVDTLDQRDDHTTLACNLPHALPRMPHAMCTPTIGVHMASRRARQACRACTPVWKACKACTPFGQACRLCTPVGSRKPLDSRGLRELRYPYKGTLRTLIRVPVPL
ncbi:hypothetical protein PCANC_08991 [Puccinia coronata f. sp. avenae]|uniref:Uncharacterized protein n=1 Tax=Puccinia coronata f. sp. avenae TaxID=200324 RepID=A0A2N5VHM8_9BASI|nr:hypothetical protein PCANC_08991 [Puccinia coronata f. sp. avenae]